MLNPELSASLLQERLDCRPGCDGLLDVVFGRGDPIQVPLLRIVIEIATQNDSPGLK
jgi:hypothetical protein